MIEYRLRQIAGRLRWRRLGTLALRGLAVALVAAIALTAISRLLPLTTRDQQLAADALLIVVSLLLSVALGLRRRYGSLEVAKIADRRAGLRERLSTAIELAGRGDSSLLALAQREDAERVATGLDPKQVVPFSMSRKAAAVPAVLLVILGAITVLPNPMHEVLRDRAATVQAIRSESARIEQVKKELLEKPELAQSEKREEMVKALDQLTKDLASPAVTSKEESLAKISSAEEKLTRLIDGSIPRERLGLDKLAKGLQGLAEMEPSLQVGEAANPDQLGQDMSEVAKKLSEMDPSELAQTAESLSNTASSLSGTNPGLATQIAKAADALQAGETQQAQEALGRAADQLNEMGQRMADQKAAEQALSQLQASRRAIASDSGQATTFVRSTQGGSGTSSTGSSGQGTSGQGNSSGNQGNSGSQGSGNGGSQGSGSGAPSGSGPIAGTNAPSSPGATSSSTGQPATGRPGTTGTGSFEPVFSPGGIDGEGKPVFLPTGMDEGDLERERVSTQPGAGVSSVPYSQVFGVYSAAAARSLDSAAIPPGMKDYVRGYFTSLEPAAKE